MVESIPLIDPSNTKVCPVLNDGKGHILMCLEDQCAWYEKSSGLCAMASLPAILEILGIIASSNAAQTGRFL